MSSQMGWPLRSRRTARFSVAAIRSMMYCALRGGAIRSRVAFISSVGALTRGKRPRITRSSLSKLLSESVGSHW